MFTRAAIRSQIGKQVNLNIRSPVRCFSASLNTSIIDTQRSKQMTERVHCKNIREVLTTVFQDAFEKAFPDENEVPAVTPCEPRFGDYQCVSAMGIFKKLKGKDGGPKNPRAVATLIQEALESGEIIQETTIAGAGYVNVVLSREWLADRINQMLVNGIESWAPLPPRERIVIDFSSPNVAKEMHVGHLRSTIIGDTISRTIEFTGASVIRLNHIGDWGTQFGMLIQLMMDRQQDGIKIEGVEEGSEDIKDLQVLYRAAKQRFDEDEDFKTRARLAVTKLQSGEESYRSAWLRICEASRREFDAIYQRLGVHLTERGESFYNPLLAPMVEELKEKGFVIESDGAQCIFLEGQKIPLIIQKSDGGFGYGATDMAAIRHRLEEEKAEWIIYVTDTGQSQHFELIFGSAKKVGWISDDPSGPRVNHVGFGLVMGEDGQKFKSRSGDVVRLVELLDEAKDRCSKTIKERREERNEPITDEELEIASCAMGYGAVKYADLKNNRLSNYKFSYDEMLSLKGNTAVYLLYAYARICGIIRNSKKDVKAMAETEKINLTHDKEVALALHLARFPEAIERAISELMPNRICEYLYELSDIFNGFYTECQVLNSENETSRLLLCLATATVKKQCFYLLGITPLERI
eukprot:g5332.t1